MEFLAVSLEPRADRVEKARKELGLMLPVAIADGELLGPLGVRDIPSTVWIDERGIVVGAASGPRSEAVFKRQTRKLFGLHR